ncbi:hypothetical protein EZV62_001708 [Acer yangbiense]|uniref:Uncharacterized protein n=1 Tax=Acer yangbiense TaxID=1000413 RepID=A0A5C7IVM8_9ROSI|nr:hypothetical protein EZV62_001708 [Acer yangbiense]
MELESSLVDDVLVKIGMFVLVQVLVYLILSNSSKIFSKNKMMRSHSFKPARSVSIRRILAAISDTPQSGEASPISRATATSTSNVGGGLSSSSEASSSIFSGEGGGSTSSNDTESTSSIKSGNGVGEMPPPSLEKDPSMEEPDSVSPEEVDLPPTMEEASRLLHFHILWRREPKLVTKEAHLLCCQRRSWRRRRIIPVLLQTRCLAMAIIC